MLLTNAIAAQQTMFAQLQAEIEQLQAKQREIQAYMQQLGSVESTMESAAQMVQQAISEIRAICPEEMANYQALIIGLFGDSPIAQLSAVVEDDDIATDVEPPTDADATKPTADIDNTIDVVAVLTDTATTTDATTTTDTPTDDDTQKGVATVVIMPNSTTPASFPTVSQVSNMKKADVQYWLQQAGEATDGKIGELRVRLNAYIMSKRTLNTTKASS